MTVVSPLFVPESTQKALAATALHHELRLVTRNEQDLVRSGLDIINPWRVPG